jgi:hypothetical protein
VICDEALKSFMALVDPRAGTVSYATAAEIAEESLERARVRSRRLH